MKIVYRKDGEFPPREIEVVGSIDIFPDSVRFYSKDARKDAPERMEEVAIECVYQISE